MMIWKKFCASISIQGNTNNNTIKAVSQAETTLSA